MNIRAASLLFAFVFGFSALPTQAQTLEERVALLEGQVAKLQGQIVAADLVGTYALRGIQMDWFDPTSSVGAAAVETDIVVGTLTLNPDLTVSGSTRDENSDLTFLTPPSVSFGSQDSMLQGVTWTYADGTVTLTFAQGSVLFAVGAGGRVLITAGSGQAQGFINGRVLIATRLQ